MPDDLPDAPNCYDLSEYVYDLADQLSGMAEGAGLNLLASALAHTRDVAAAAMETTKADPGRAPERVVG